MVLRNLSYMTSGLFSLQGNTFHIGHAGKNTHDKFARGRIDTPIMSKVMQKLGTSSILLN
jgi:hypothetical protein